MSSAASEPSASRPRPRRRLSASATSRDCAPSCRLRSSRRRSSSPAWTSRARDARSSTMRARNSASRRWFSSSSAVAAPAARTVSSSARRRRGRSPRSAAPSRSTSVTARSDGSAAAGAPRLVDVAALLGHPVGEAQRRVSERGRERRAQIGRAGRSDSRATRLRTPRACGDVRACEAGQERERRHGEREERQRHERRRLGRDVGEDQQQRDRPGAEQRREAAALRRSRGPPARDQHAHDQQAEGHHHGRAGGEQDLAETLVVRDQQRVLGARPVAVREHVGLADQHSGHRRERHEDIGGDHDGALAGAGQPPRREAEQHVREHRPPQRAEHDPEREQPRVRRRRPSGASSHAKPSRIIKAPNRDSGRRRDAYRPVPTKLHPTTGPNTAQTARSAMWSLLSTSAHAASPASSAAPAMTAGRMSSS